MDRTIIELFYDQADTTPDRIAVVFEGRSLSYRQLDERSNQLAHRLLASGIKAEDIVPIWLDRSPEMIISIIGVLKAGAAYAPIDPATPLIRAEYMIRDSQAGIVITDRIQDHDRHNDAVIIQLTDEAITRQPVTRPIVPIRQEQLAYVIYTSGSTGKPKGVMVEHHSVANLISWHNAKFKVGPACRLTLVAGVAFDIAVWEIWSALLSGAPLYIVNNEERLQAGLLLSFCRQFQITHSFAPTVLIPEMIYSSKGVDLMLQYLFTAGEQLKPVDTTDIPYTLIDYYGPTECTIFATYHPVVPKDGALIPAIGKPVGNAKAYILSPQLDIVPIGATGELCISGAGLARGYLHDAMLTAAKFIDNPFEPGGRLYLTGDLARWLPEGDIQFLGRSDGQIKIRGYRIELGEIEQALSTIAGIKQAVVIAKVTVNDQKYLKAFIVLQNDLGVSGTKGLFRSIRDRLKTVLPSYMVPSHFAILEKIPVTENGKTNRQALAALPEEASPDIQAIALPADECEKAVADIWREALAHRDIDVTDNFFDIGGHSIQVAYVRSRLTETFPVKIYIRDLYEHPTVRSLAAVITRRKEIGSGQQTQENDAEPASELWKDVYLPPGVKISGTFDEDSMKHPKNVLLTGATGFVGIHLLAELLERTNANIYCLIRGNNEYQAIEKIYHYFGKYRVPIVPGNHRRIIPVLGDLSLPLLGLRESQFDLLAKEVDIIYHSGSSVNFIEPYSVMKGPNVDGLREIIRLAARHKLKCLSLLSTISVYSWGHVFTHKTVMTEKDDIAQNLQAVTKDIGYVRSKWVMEAIADLAVSRGLPVIVYRLGYAMCHSITGACADYQWWAGLVRNCINQRSFPLLTELREGLITVDYMTRAIAHISGDPSAIGLKFNLIASPEKNLTLIEFFTLLHKKFGFDLSGSSYRDWRKQWEADKNNPLYPLTSLFKDDMYKGLSTVELYQHTYIWDRTNTDRFLKDSAIREPEFDRNILDAYLAYLNIAIPTL